MTSLTRAQRRRLLKMMFSGDEPMMSTCPKKDRTCLVDGKLLTLQKRGRATHMMLTDRAWREARSLISAELEANDTRRDLAFHLLMCLDRYLDAEGVALTDFVQPPTPPDPHVAVRSAYLRLTQGRFARQVRLADLRHETRAMATQELEGALRELMRRGEAHLMPIDDPLDRSPRDDAAAMRIAGQPRHVVYLEAV